MSNTSPKTQRPSKFDHYLNRAKSVAERSTCRRRKVGAVIIKDDVEISSGYVGSPRGMDNCIDIERCLRIELGIPSGQRYELCRSVHAEQNALINAARMGVSVREGEMYISSEKLKGGYRQISKLRLEIYGPCIICKKEIINVGLKAVHMREEGVGVRSYTSKKIGQILREEESEIRDYLKNRGKKANE